MVRLSTHPPTGTCLPTHPLRWVGGSVGWLTTPGFLRRLNLTCRYICYSLQHFISMIIRRAITYISRPSYRSTFFRLASSYVQKDPGIGDYPTNIPFINTQYRDPHIKYDDQQNRRITGETLHEQDEVLNIFAPDPMDMVPPGVAARQFLYFWIVLGTFVGVLYLVRPEPIATPRKYPYGGLMKELGAKPDDAFSLAALSSD
ncbi:hypothetical protein NEOLI_001393 [Neolecta irregularis DAH-3]|uniref:NADH dehydrogenase [ubiquinone] 1 beta subcomplex subunit 8, mitochondrial n=1 Tax=Neolecta irregularis (strain DAH-3) TaxID=1198029 RepID=A0A1U7LT73_NEOID|nr:hypothetical protein NEOLI_001393 [Neolecta irregularis DAH-3]|eukprot:OLL25876.1 hypothetical protein NEOLI_001393 [Neolecta irregularis DAH-3]